MSVSLVNNAGERFGTGNRTWVKLLTLASTRGWVPAGTVPPEDGGERTWDGGYWSNDGQRVTAEDAEALATALESAMADVPTGSGNSGSIFGTAGEILDYLQDEMERLSLAWGDRTVSPEVIGITGSMMIDVIEKLIAFCRMGEFTIR